MICRQIQGTVEVGRILHRIPVDGNPDDLSLTVHRAKLYGEESNQYRIRCGPSRARSLFVRLSFR